MNAQENHVLVFEIIKVPIVSTMSDKTSISPFYLLIIQYQ